MTFNIQAYQLDGFEGYAEVALEFANQCECVPVLGSVDAASRQGAGKRSTSVQQEEWNSWCKVPCKAECMTWNRELRSKCHDPESETGEHTTRSGVQLCVRCSFSTYSPPSRR